jgi:hypothetical protein
VQYHAAVTDKPTSTNAGGWNGMMNINKNHFNISFS